MVSFKANTGRFKGIISRRFSCALIKSKMKKSTVGFTVLATPMPIRAVVAFIISLSFAFLSLVASSDATKTP